MIMLLYFCNFVREKKMRPMPRLALPRQNASDPPRAKTLVRVLIYIHMALHTSNVEVFVYIVIDGEDFSIKLISLPLCFNFKSFPHYTSRF